MTFCGKIHHEFLERTCFYNSISLWKGLTRFHFEIYRSFTKISLILYPRTWNSITYIAIVLKNSSIYLSNFFRVSQKSLVNDAEVLYFLDQEQSRRAPEQTKVQRRSTTCRYKSHTCVLTGYPFAEHRFVIFETLFVHIPFPFSNYLFLYSGKIIFIYLE